MASYEVLQGYYALHDELGSGGFGKVKLATHLLTDQKVAIKIIDKKKIGHDLPRVKTEMDALRTLSHQNICRLYHFIETEEKFFIVMEFCSGGEMFDYIVRKERLEESEARHFFRQLVSAIAYVHSQGFAHRDLKPENLLLTEDLHLKLIDFGLCAKAAGRLEMHGLDTCCGSPAYAAPELIQGQIYKGNEADVWSMGVLLYALLCGALPFEDDNMQMLYRKISRGAYHEPEWLSQCSKQLLKAMLQVNPRDRITIKELLAHPWMNHKYSQPIKWSTIYDKNMIDEDIAREMAFYYRLSLAQMIDKIKEWPFDYMTSTYYLLLQKKRRGSPYALPMPLASRHLNTNESNVLGSPTIHASLDNNLDKSGLEEDSQSLTSSGSDAASRTSSDDSREKPEPKFAKPLSPEKDKKLSYAAAMFNMPSQFTGMSPQAHQRHYESPSVYDDRMTTPSARQPRTVVRAQGEANGEKENKQHYVRSGAASCKMRGPLKITDDGTRRSVYTTPSRPPLRGLFSPGGEKTAPRPRARSTDRGAPAGSGPAFANVPGSPASIGSGNSLGAADGRTPRSSTKTPRLRQRVFTSLERKAERMINLLTPRKVKNESPQVLRSAKNMVNVSMTSSTSAERVREELVKVFEQTGLQYELNGWKISGRQRGGGFMMTVELEVVMLEGYGKIGIRRKRLNGDAFLYKRVCEKILQMADIDAEYERAEIERRTISVENDERVV